MKRNDAKQNILASLTPPKLISELKKRKKWQEQRGKTFRIKQPRQLDPRSIERSVRRAYKIRMNNLIKLVNEQLIPRLPELIAGEDSSKPETPKPITRKKEKRDALGTELAIILNGIQIEFGRDLTEAELAIAAEKSGLAVNAHNLAQLSKSLKTVLDVDVFGDEPFLRAQVENYVEQNVALIKSVDERYFTEVQREIFAGTRQGLSTKEISEKIRERGKVAKSRADLIARDQINKLNGSISKLRQTNLGVGRYVWRTSLDERVRPAHISREGKIFSWDEPPSDGHPGEPINCRCYAEPVLEDLIEESE